MTTHTPGPWTVYKETECSPGIEADAVGFSVVTYGIGSESAGVHGRTNAEAVANANLIAAAPDLLEALRMAEAWIMEHRTAGKSDCTLAQIRAAIAKAEGKS